LVGESVRDLFRTNPEVDSDAYAWKGDNTITEFSLGGYLHRACVNDYRAMLNQRHFLGKTGVPAANELILHAQPLHRNIVSGVMAIARFLNRLHIKTPWQIAISLVGMKGYWPLDDAGNPARRPFGNDIHHLPVLRLSNATVLEDGMQAGLFLKPALESLTRSVGWEFNWYYSSPGVFSLRV